MPGRDPPARGRDKSPGLWPRSPPSESCGIRAAPRARGTAAGARGNRYRESTQVSRPNGKSGHPHSPIEL
eukprot:5019399-Prymnesium_polylepis.1